MDGKGRHGQSTPSGSLETTKWDELRSLLTGPEQHQLAQISKRLNDPVRRAEELAQTLPDALSISISSDDRVARALQPTLDTALKNSVRTNPKSIADAIFPVLGPAIRKAISATLMGMIQSLNHVLNQSFSLQGWKWRLEAMRTQRSFAEIVLLHTLVYRVEQIFLIHHQTGVVLQHAQSNQTQDRDPDLVSGMLTAIQDFVKDSFDAKTGEMLDTLRMDGDHSVWVEQGAQVILAVVIRGTPPLSLRRQFRELLDEVHTVFVDTLDHFTGDITPFAMIRPKLEDALTFKVRSDSPRISPWVWVLLTAVLCAVGYWAHLTYKNHRDWQNLLSHLRAESGIVVTIAERRNGRHFIAGLKDPMARDPQKIIAASKVAPEKIETRWKPYRALDGRIIISRARHVLNPPATVELQWSHGTLVALGRANHLWVKRFRQLAATIAGVDAYDDRQLKDEEMDQLITATKQLEGLSILFKKGEARLSEDQIKSLQSLLNSVVRINHLSREMAVSVDITIIGHTDPTGNTEFNILLSQQRAQVVLRYLIRNGSNPSLLKAFGAGSKTRINTVASAPDKRVLRHVTFRTQIAPR